MSWITNRFVVTFGGTAILVALWNVYVAFHDDGILEGRVVGPDGSPVAGATVSLTERTLLVARPRDATTTDAEGRFVFTGHHLHHLYLDAAKDGVGRAGPVEYRLYFQGQNMALDAPLQLSVPAGA